MKQFALFFLIFAACVSCSKAKNSVTGGSGSGRQATEAEKNIFDQNFLTTQARMGSIGPFLTGDGSMTARFTKTGDNQGVFGISYSNYREAQSVYTGCTGTLTGNMYQNSVGDQYFNSEFDTTNLAYFHSYTFYPTNTLPAGCRDGGMDAAQIYKMYDGSIILHYDSRDMKMVPVN